jgi:hypothetical protein
MAQRLELQALLESLVPNVYFQPPESVKLQYPCIIYKREFRSTEFADNQPYKDRKRYQVIVIDSDPDSAIPDQVAALPLCVFDRFYTADKLNHDVFRLFF